MWTSWFWSPEHRDNIDSKNFGNAVFVGMPGLLKPVKLWELSNLTGWKKMICHIFSWSFPFPQVCISLLFRFSLLFNCLDNPFHSPSFNFALMLTVLLNKYRRGLQRSNYNSTTLQNTTSWWKLMDGWTVSGGKVMCLILSSNTNIALMSNDFLTNMSKTCWSSWSIVWRNII